MSKQINGQSLIHNTPPWMSIDKRMCLVKTLLEKTLWDKKNVVKEKKYNIVHHILYFSPSCKLTSLRWWSLNLWIIYSKVLLGKNFINRPAIFSHEWIFGYLYHPFNWTIHYCLHIWLLIPSLSEIVTSFLHMLL